MLSATSDGGTTATDPALESFVTSTAASTVNEQQSQLMTAANGFVGDTAGLFSEPDYLSAVQNSPIATIIAPFQSQLETNSSQNEQLTEQSQQQQVSGDNQAVATSGQQSIPVESQQNATGTLFGDQDNATGVASAMLWQASAPQTNTTTNSGTTTAGTTSGGTGGDAVVDDDVEEADNDPRKEWTPFVYPAGVEFPSVDLSTDAFLGDLGQIQPQGNTSFATTNTVALPRQSFATAPEWGEGQKTIDVSTTVTTRQKWISDSEWTVTRTQRNEFISDERSTDENAVEEDFGRTAVETFTVTIINGTRRIITWSQSDTFGFGAEDRPETDSASEGGIYAAESIVSGDAVDGDDSDTPDNGKEFESHFDANAEVSITFEENIVTLPDGRLAHVYSLNFGTGRSFSSRAKGGYGVSEKEGELKDFPLTPSSSSGSGTTTSRSSDSVLQLSETPTIGPVDSPLGRPVDPNKLPPGTMVNQEIEQGGNGSSIEASGGFEFSAGASIGTSLLVSAVVPAGTSINDAEFSGGTGFNVGANASGEVHDSIAFQSQESAGSVDDGSATHEYISFEAGGGGGGGKDFTFNADSRFGGFEGTVPVYGRPAASTVANLGANDSASEQQDATTRTIANIALQRFLASDETDETATSETSDEEATIEDPQINIGFGVKIKDHGNGAASIRYSSESHPSPVDTVKIGHGSGYSGSFSSDFDLGTLENGDVGMTATAGFGASGGSSTGMVHIFIMQYPKESLGWLGPNALSFMHRSTITSGQGKTLDTHGSITVAFGVSGGLSMSPVLSIEMSDTQTLTEKFENYAKFRGADGGIFSRDQVIDGYLATKLIISGNLVDGINVTTDVDKHVTITNTETGTPPSNSQSSDGDEDPTTTVLDSVQLGLDLLGMIPAVGEAADLVNAGIHLARGNHGEAALSLAAMVPILGAAATAGKLGSRAAKVATKVAGKLDEVAAVGKQGVDKIVTACKNGPNCFVAGTQVVVAVEGTAPASELAAARADDAALIDQVFESPDVAFDFDRYAAAGAFLLAAGLSVRRRPQSNRRKRQLLASEI